MIMYADPLEQATKEFAELLSAGAQKLGITLGQDEIEKSISIPKENYDISSTLPFYIAGKIRKDPAEIAKELAEGMTKGKYIDHAVAVGPYINAFFDRREFGMLVIRSVATDPEGYGNNALGSGRKVIVESPSVNPSKPWHIGHLRNAILGDVISNLLERSSYTVEREDYIDDLGLQVAESLWGYIHLPGKPDKKFDQWLGEQYVEVNRMLSNPEIKKEIDDLQKEIEEGTTENARKAREFAEKCVEAQYQTAFSYNIYHDVLIWESDIVRARIFEEAMGIAWEKSILEKPETGTYAGCTVVNIKDIKQVVSGLGDVESEAKVLIKSNGTSTYLAKDFAFHMWKFGYIPSRFKYVKFMEKQPNGKPLYSTAAEGEQKEFGNVDMAINVIGSAQRYPQLILKGIFTLLDKKKGVDSLVHLSYGEVGLKEGTLSGRKGGWIGKERNYTADDLLQEAIKKTKEIVERSGRAFAEGKADEIARSVAVAAIRFEFLRVAPEKRITFSWEQALNFEANSGPYCMYAYARAASILEKAKELKAPAQEDFDFLTDGYDYALVKLIAQAPRIIAKAAREYRPNVLTDYLLDISSTFSKFYETMHVINSGEAETLRLAIVGAAKTTLGNMLKALGVEPLEHI